MAAFTALIAMPSNADEEPHDLERFAGLFWRQPLVASVFSIALLSLVGMPLTAGFFAKLYALFAGVRADLWGLIAAFMLRSAVSIFYYVRIILVMLESSDAAGARLGRPVGLVLAATGLVVVGLGVYPGPVVDLAHRLVRRPPAERASSSMESLRAAPHSRPEPAVSTRPRARP